jgi:CubicO group peptidase (beta-lactamase class C family)
MKNTGYREDMEVVHKNTATSYNGNRQDGFRQPLKYWTYLGNGNIYTTIDDLARWMDNFRTLKVGGATAIQTLVTPGILNNGDTLDYALGIGVGEYRGLKRYSHGGSIGGYRSYLLYFPEQEFGVIVLSNFSSAGPAGKAMAIADIVLGDRLAPKKENEEEERVTEKAAAPYTPNKSDLEALAGLYYSPELDTRYQFSAQAGKMRVQHQRHEDFFLEPRAEDQFRATASFFRNVTIIPLGLLMASQCLDS